jgi:hypothetical protein
VTLLGMIGLAVDGGYYVTERRQAQNAADSAALAAAERIAAGASTVQAEATALYYAAQNGYDNDGTSNTVTVHRPPTTGAHVGDDDFVEVIINEDPDTFFIHAVYNPGEDIVGRGVAGSTNGGVGSYAVLVLNETACQTFNKTGSGNFSVTGGGGIMVNSNCNPGIRQTGSGSTSAGAIDFYEPGGYTLTGSGSFSPTPSGVPARVADPLSSIVQPVPGVTVGTSPNSGGTAAAPAMRTISGSGNTTLQPGTYWGGLTLSGSGNVTFMPGLYIFAGGGLTQTGSGNLSGAGVTFFSTNDPTQPAGAGAYNNFDLAGSGNRTFSPQTTGPYANILWWQDRNAPNDISRQFNKTGSGNFGNGIIYLPNAKMNLAGSGNLGGVQIIVDAIDVAGSGNQTVPYTSYVSMGLPSVALVE